MPFILYFKYLHHNPISRLVDKCYLALTSPHWFNLVVDGDSQHISLASVAKVCRRSRPLVINMVIGILIGNMVE